MTKSKYIHICIGKGFYDNKDEPCDPKYTSYARKPCEERELIKLARIISKNLAIYQYEKSTVYLPSWYHVIHIPTGLVIAAVEYALVSDVKKTFEDTEWTLRGDNTLVMIPKPQTKYQKLYNQKPLSWEMTCLIRYKVIESE